jgi:hypothetical protein
MWVRYLGGLILGCLILTAQNTKAGTSLLPSQRGVFV